MRRLLIAALLVSGAPAVAQSADSARINRPSAYETYRTRTVTVYGNDACPKPSDPDEIVVCARRPEGERYRLKNPDATSASRPEIGGADRTLGAMDLANSGGTGSCTPVGPGGASGCNAQFIARERAIRKQQQAEDNAPPPRN